MQRSEAQTSQKYRNGVSQRHGARRTYLWLLPRCPGLLALRVGPRGNSSIARIRRDSGKGIVAATDQGDPDRDFVALRIGQAVGRYRIAADLGRGGFGITYRALDAELGCEVALKEYLPAALAVRQDGTTVVPRSTSAAQDYAWGRERFVTEGRTLAALHRVPGIVLVHDFLVANGTAYLVMELLAGQTLQDRVVRHGPLDATAFDQLLP